MNNSSLKHTKKRLTIIFTLLVFALAILLEWVFFTAKYYNYINTEEKTFSTITTTVENKFVSLKDFINNYDIWNRLFRIRQGAHMDVPKVTHEDPVNIIIINKDKIEVVFSNVVDEISIDLVENVLYEEEYNKIEQDYWFLVKKIELIDSWINYDILFIKKLRYNFSDYLTDLLGFVFITLLFGVFFYYIWYKFVSKNLEPVENNLRDMQDFIHNAWHELKTPIAIIHSNLQLIKETKSYEKDLIQEWLTEITKLDHLIESLVELSNINSSNNSEKISLKDEIKSVIKDFKVEADKKKIEIKVLNSNEKVLTINKQYFYILFSNLLWNAIKYSKKWAKIEISLNKNNFSIKDNWIWIKKHDIDKIFDRFYMSEQCRNVDGHGIWLSLVKKIADMYNFKIKVNSEIWKWTEFIVEY